MLAAEEAKAMSSPLHSRGGPMCSWQITPTTLPWNQTGTSSIEVIPSGRRYPDANSRVAGSRCASSAAIGRSPSSAEK